MELTSISSLDGLDEIRGFWQSRQRHPNSDFEQFGLICRIRPDVVAPHVVVIGSRANPSAILVGRIDRTHFTPSIGYFKPVRIPARVLTVLYQGLIGELGEPEGEALIDHLWKWLRTGQVDAVRFHHVAEQSPLRLALGNTPAFWSQKNSTWAEHWQLTIPREVGGLLEHMKPKHRKWLRKKEGDLEAAFPSRVQWRWIRDVGSLDELCARMEGVAARTYQRGLEAGFKNDPEHRARLGLLAQNKQLRVQVLEIDQAIRAFWLGSTYGDAFHSWATAFDPDLREYEPGNLLFHRMVDELSREGIEKLDFGLGDAFYKKRFGDESWKEGTLSLFAPTARGTMLRAAVGATNSLDRAGRRIVNAIGKTDYLKTAWRKRLAQSNQ